MDLLYFLKSRLRFIEQFYDGAVSSFIETKRKIDAGEPPLKTLPELSNTSGKKMLPPLIALPRPSTRVLVR